MLVLITYDVNTTDAAGEERLRNGARGCGGDGERGEDSVFECRLEDARLCVCKTEGTKRMANQKKTVHFCTMVEDVVCLAKHIGVRSGYQPDDVLML